MLLFVLLLFVCGVVIYKSCSLYRTGFIKLISIMSHTEYQSDDEIFFGKLSLKEFKKHIKWNGHSNFEQNRGVNEVNNDPDTSIKIIETHSEPNLRPTKEEKVKYLSEPGSPVVNVKSPSDESFLQIETMVGDLCVSPRTSDNVELNNTLELIEYILNNGPKHVTEPDKVAKLNINEKVDENKNNYEQEEIGTVEKCPQTEMLQSHEQMMLERSPKKETLVNIENVTTETKEPIKYFTPLKLPNELMMLEKSPKKETLLKIKNVMTETEEPIKYFTPLKSPNELMMLERSPKKERLLKVENVTTETKEPIKYFTPLKLPNEQMMLEKSPKKETLVKIKNVTTDTEKPMKYFTPLKLANSEIFKTPSSNSVKKTPVFKTPAPLSNRKLGLSVKKSPGRSNAYQHIASPIASYIKNSPQVPLVKDVYPKKPLPRCSSIPKLKPTTQQPIKSHNKENMMLPQVAYKSAKKTIVINIDNERMPQSLWAKKITSTLPRPTVMKHENRKMNPLKKTLLTKHEDSVANLSCLQAEVSVCTEKTAFKKN